MHRDRIVGVLTTILGAAVAYMTSQLAGTNMPGDPAPKFSPTSAQASCWSAA